MGIGRRSFVAAVIGTLLAGAARMSRAQTGRKPRRLAMLFAEPITANEIRNHPTRARLAELGWVEGATVIVDRAFANADSALLPELARRLVLAGPDVIWVDGFGSAVAASRATTKIPIVFCGVWQPAEQGLIDSYARPGRNLTGIANGTGVATSTKRLELLKQVVPAATRLSWIFPGPDEVGPVGKPMDLAPFEQDARRVGFVPRLHVMAESKDIEGIFRDILSHRAEAVSIGDSVAILANRARIIEFANRHRLPTAAYDASFVDAGALLSLGPDNYQTRRRSADYVDRILKGANPAEMPVEQPKEFPAVINLRAAKVLGLTIPQSVLLRADRIIR